MNATHLSKKQNYRLVLFGRNATLLTRPPMEGNLSLKKPIELSTPVFIENEKGRLHITRLKRRDIPPQPIIDYSDMRPATVTAHKKSQHTTATETHSAFRIKRSLNSTGTGGRRQHTAEDRCMYPAQLRPPTRPEPLSRARGERGVAARRGVRVRKGNGRGYESATQCHV